MKKVDSKEKARVRELRVLEQWKADDTFRKSIDNREGRTPFVFYDGPPTANGKPHIGHMLGRVIKDFVGRYKTMSGYHVIRKAGWDTHGLPVELGMEKQLGISGKQEIEAYGIGKFVEACKSSVFVYEQQWRELSDAVAHWIDMDDPYITLTNDYIESVWHILSDVHSKGLLYKGHRVSPYCPDCQTSLSSHEVSQGYEDVKDLSATVKFRAEEGGESFLAWTTTPWTLPANIALAVGKDIDYVKVRQGDEVYIVAASLADKVLSESSYEVLSQHKGAEFVGRRYTPPFAYVEAKKGFVVIAADFVSDASGTGIVHIAPAHGEDDYRVAQANGLDFVGVVDLAGCYTATVSEFAGRFVKDCDVDVVRSLAERGLLFAKERYEHSYPFCWRCHTPLLYYAMESWFIKTTAVKEQMIANNSQVNWYPGHLREGRFGNFLEDMVDWNISRSRYWGTPLNVWLCPDCGAESVPGSHRELRERAIGDIAPDLELHRPYIDEVKLRCSCGGVMTRTPEVIDVWFDSGSMPFAQYHYPFAENGRFASQFPADIICEGIDQTRGWFYSLLAVSTLYTGQAPYKAVLSTGHILDENGQKMSKSKGNVIDPWEVIEEYGADALRWALLSDSAPWNSKRFSKRIVGEAKSKVIDTLVNTHAFYTLYALIDGVEPDTLDRDSSAFQGKQPASFAAAVPSANPLDRWLLSRLNSTLLAVGKGLELNDFLAPSRQIESFIDELSNWYVRRSRDRFWGADWTEDKSAAYRTLREVLLVTARMMAPFTPLLAEELYGNLGGGGSVHLTDYPQADEAAIDRELEQTMAQVRQIVELARSVRNETALKTRQPLAELIISSSGQPVDIGSFAELIQDEINVKQIMLAKDDSQFMQYNLKLNLKEAGKIFGKQVGAIQGQLRELSAEEARRVVEDGQITLTIDGEAVTVVREQLLVDKQALGGYASASGGGLTVALHTELTAELKQEGLVREVVRMIQDYRKKLELPIDKRIRLVLDAEPELKEALTQFHAVLADNVLLEAVRYAREDGMDALESGDCRILAKIE